MFLLLKKLWNMIEYQGIIFIIKKIYQKFQVGKLRLHNDNLEELSDKNNLDEIQSFYNFELFNIQNIPNVSIVIPIYNGYSYVKGCIESVYNANNDVSIEIIAVDNNSTDGTLELLKRMRRIYPSFKLIENNINQGFAIAVNQGSKVAKGEFLLILNSDIVVTDHWLDYLINILKEDLSLAVVSPITNSIGNQPQRDELAKYVKPHQANSYAKKCSKRKEVISIFDVLTFFCVAIRKNVFDLIGGLSNLYGLGNFEDNDFCLRVRMLGFKLAVVTRSFVYHFGSRTFTEQKINHNELMQKNEKIFFNRIAQFSTDKTFRSKFKKDNLQEISVILITNNGHNMLENALTSLANQTISGFDVIIITDDKKQISGILNEYSSYLSIKVISQDLNNMNYLSINSAINLSSGKYITYMKDKDIIYPYHIEILSSPFYKSSKINVTCSLCNIAIYNTSRSNNKINLINRKKFTQNITENIEVEYYPLMNIMHIKELFLSIQGFNNSFRHYYGWDFIYQLKRKYGFNILSTITSEKRFYDDENYLSEKVLHEKLREIEIFYKKFPSKDQIVNSKRKSKIQFMKKEIDSSGVEIIQG